MGGVIIQFSDRGCVDANLLRRDDEDLATKLSYLSSLMALALACTADSPEERINMKDVVVTQEDQNQTVDVRITSKDGMEFKNIKVLHNTSCQ